jgi:hypothetical protein
MKMTTYALAREYPRGMSIVDAITIVNGRKRVPITLMKVGDKIDLELVDVLSFSKSAFSGTIRHLFLTGVLAAEVQEVSQARGVALEEAFLRLNETGGHPTGMIGDPTIVMLEPGVTIGVQNIPEMQTELPVATMGTGADSLSVRLEPGSAAPGAILDPAANTPPPAPKPDIRDQAAGIKPPGLDQGNQVIEQKAEAPKKRRGRKDPAAQEAAAEAPKVETFERWKDNLDLQTQKGRVAISEDRDFLRWVAEHDESRQLQKIAAARLAELDKAA